eukprot:SAG31_NODE_3821_length_3852_cov_4.553424_1_plen_84_part_00
MAALNDKSALMRHRDELKHALTKQDGFLDEVLWYLRSAYEAIATLDNDDDQMARATSEHIAQAVKVRTTVIDALIVLNSMSQV